MGGGDSISFLVVLVRTEAVTRDLGRWGGEGEILMIFFRALPFQVFRDLEIFFFFWAKSFGFTLTQDEKGERDFSIEVDLVFLS